MSGISSWGSYLPYRRLDRSTISDIAGRGGGKGLRSVACFDEDTTTLAVAAARRALRGEIQGLLFSTPTPAYLEKTNAATIHAALQLPSSTPAYDLNGSVHSGMAALRMALSADGPMLVVTSDLRGGLAGGADEAGGADGAAALVVGPDSGVAELVSWTSMTQEFLDRWRIPGDLAPRSWEERFGEVQYVDCGVDCWTRALSETGLDAAGVDLVAVVGTHDRAVAAVTKKLGVAAETVHTGQAAVGNLGGAAPLAALASMLEVATPGQTVALVVLADGAEVVIFKATDALAAATRGPSLAVQAAGGAPISYGRYLAWRGMLTLEPPRRPEPARPSASAAARSTDWKFGLVDAEGTAFSGAQGTIVTFTIDRLVYSQSPPVVFAIVDFPGGKRIPVELTDCDPNDVVIGQSVEMTFRKLFTSDGIHNYFWKARPI